MSPRTVILFLFFGLITVGIVGPVEPVLADGPPPDNACRTCHSGNQRELPLPSGELLPLRIPLEGVDSSPHNSGAQNPVLCLDCHRGRINYQYPHQPNPAQTRREFALAVSENCQTCHFPHSPLHPPPETADQPPNPDYPACVDCHDSHEMDRVDNILNSMPSACLVCHTYQTPAWVANFIAPRPGLGQGAAGYIGSDRCAGCHEQKYFSWRQTLHARLIQDPAADPTVVVGDFNQNDPDRDFTLAQVVLTIGSRWKQQYLTRDEAGNFYVLPAQWNVTAGEWVAYNPDSGQTEEWRQNCGSCHVTGLDTQTREITEFGVGCEACHGPGADHAANPKKVKPFAQVDDQVCGACHSRGVSPDGFAFPATYRPGDTLTDHFTFTTDPAAVWPDGSAKKNHQQYMDWQLGSPMALAATTSCATCHAVHDNGAGQTQLVTPLNDLCLRCHNDKKAIINHVPFHDKASTRHEFTCADCHLPPMAASAEPNDIHNHSFLQPNPQGTLDHGGLAQMPNACNVCHTKLGEEPQWAAQTIAYVVARATPGAGAIFGPGPTPTSPPPPTPLPSVGQPAVEVTPVATGRWLRITAFIVIGVGLIWGAYKGYRSMKSRGELNA